MYRTDQSSSKRLPANPCLRIENQALTEPSPPSRSTAAEALISGLHPTTALSNNAEFIHQNLTRVSITSSPVSSAAAERCRSPTGPWQRRSRATLTAIESELPTTREFVRLTNTITICHALKLIQIKPVSAFSQMSTLEDDAIGGNIDGFDQLSARKF